MSYNTKNYMEQGGGKLVIDGELVVTENATVTGLVDVAQLKKPTATQFGGVKAAAAGEGDTVEVKVAANGKLYVPTYPEPYELPTATGEELGGVMASEAGEDDTVPCKIGADGKLYVPTYPVVPEIPIAANIPASEATTVELLLADFNALLAALKAAGLMAADEPTEDE